MCTVFRSLLHMNKLLGVWSFSQKAVETRRLIHLVGKLNTYNDPVNDRPPGKVSSSFEEEHHNHNLTGIVPPKYKVFRDEDAPIIFDVDEERAKINLEEIVTPYEESDIYEGINLNRGISGVYELDDLVDLLRKNNVMDLFVAAVPPELVYVDYVIIVTGRSSKHMKATAEIIRRVFKKKRHSTDPLPKIEGKNSKDWIAIDLGNLALHIFSQQARKIYDLETLWTVGSKYDDQSNMPIDQLTDLLQKHSFLDGLQPAEINN
ncbi:uncharacterized protein LOC107223621 [Neodiprion lecontei]|uniref:Uncharacterized protein LOC107223621 n=1 Tax=Neodiprion lecontei TaxID=441921 RepID=A0A6J0BXL4_NEOLC|nr:uncharacterized protein LOC107223621 [Neodiprion lecontei]